ncbi:Reticuline oxidase-like protein [Acorus calamus]|uniref:Reticuline oxidase-like protein n=1 Tax=Acorus calamus TaxID=4465 RepID=A0AAV9C516_ACOCL|nr:Reticuline oxidase-like protein [Acorus calamus]
MALQSLILLLSLLPLFITPSIASQNTTQESFLHCLSHHHPLPTYTPNTTSYNTLLNSTFHNLRFATSASAAEPVLIIAPADEAQAQASVACARAHRLNVRIRSGGHDYEGLSYRTLSDRPFAILDLSNLREIDVDVENGFAWVQSGAILGELYYKVAQASKTHGFPAGLCPTIGVGGHLSGGGFGTMLRQQGIAADHVIDARVIDARGRILDRASMGEDLFWAIRGGGGASFCVIISYKVFPVPPTVTVFTINRTLAQGATRLVHKWQTVAPRLDRRLFVRTLLSGSGAAAFNSMFLGAREELMRIMDQRFPELGLKAEDCFEMSWIESAVYFAVSKIGQPTEVLLDRSLSTYPAFKAKSDFVREPIPEEVLEAIFGWLKGKTVVMLMDPWGGRMDDVSESEIPFPHRAGNLYNIQYYDYMASSKGHVEWLRRFYEYMGAYVSKGPRRAYLNYRDLDLGWNEEGNETSFEEGEVWGRKYFVGNYERLALVKGVVDPGNFFRNEQSIPPLIVKGY